MDAEEKKMRRRQRLYAICDMSMRLQTLIDDGRLVSSDNKIEEMIVETMSKKYAEELFEAVRDGRSFDKTPSDYLEDELLLMGVIRPGKKIWYKESWTKEDLIKAVYAANPPVTEEKILELSERMKMEFIHDKDERRKSIRKMAEEIF